MLQWDGDGDVLNECKHRHEYEELYAHLPLFFESKKASQKGNKMKKSTGEDFTCGFRVRKMRANARI